MLKDVAEDIGMHESTISRATANKYAHTPQGIFELKFFFTSGVKAGSGEDVSAETVKEKIRAMVTDGAAGRSAFRSGDRGNAAPRQYQYRPPHGGEVSPGVGNPAVGEP